MPFYCSGPVAARIGNAVVRQTLQQFGDRGLDPNRFALTLLLHPEPLTRSQPSGPPEGFGYRSGVMFYPCSVVKAFYLVACMRRIADGQIAMHAELERAMRDMILHSSNTATNYVIDLITGTTGDTLLPPQEFAAWADKRQWVNRFFAGLGWPELDGINVLQKLMDDVRYGRESQLLHPNRDNHNRLSTDATARLFYEIFSGRMIDRASSLRLAEFLSRTLDPAVVETEPHVQIKGYFGEGLPRGARLWSKAGQTNWIRDPVSSWGRHDAAYAELPEGRAFTLVAFTHGKQTSADLTCLPFIARTVCALLPKGAET